MIKNEILKPLGAGLAYTIHTSACNFRVCPFFCGGAADMEEKYDIFSLVASLRQEKLNLVLAYRDGGGVGTELRTWDKDNQIMLSGDDAARARGLEAEDRRRSALFTSGCLLFRDHLAYCCYGIDLMHDVQALVRLDALVKHIFAQFQLRSRLEVVLALHGVRALGFSTGALYDTVTDLLRDGVAYTAAVISMVRAREATEAPLWWCVDALVGFLDLVACYTDYAGGLLVDRARRSAKILYDSLRKIAVAYPTVRVFTPKLYELCIFGPPLLQLVGSLHHVSSKRLEESHLQTKRDADHVAYRDDSHGTLLVRDQIRIALVVANAMKEKATFQRHGRPPALVRAFEVRRFLLKGVEGGELAQATLLLRLVRNTVGVINALWGKGEAITTDEAVEPELAQLVTRLLEGWDVLEAGDELHERATYGVDALFDSAQRVPLQTPFSAVGLRGPDAEKPVNRLSEQQACDVCRDPACLLHRGVEGVGSRSCIATTVTAVPLGFLRARRRAALTVTAPSAITTLAVLLKLRASTTVDRRASWSDVGDFYDFADMTKATSASALWMSLTSGGGAQPFRRGSRAT